MANTTIVPKHIAEAIVSPRAHAEPIERDALFSGLRYLRVTNPVKRLSLALPSPLRPFGIVTVKNRSAQSTGGAFHRSRAKACGDRREIMCLWRVH
jgi:hypothetical protein